MFPNSVLIFIFIILLMAVFLVLKRDINTKLSQFDNSYSKKDEIIKNIEVAEDIIEELNDIGENLIKRLDEKIVEINELLKKSEELINSFSDHYEEKLNTDKDKLEPKVLPQEETVKIDNIKFHGNFKDNKEIEKIIELTNKGYPPAQVAKFLNKGIGEINLILNLKKK